jgi:hypothetical protein
MCFRGILSRFFQELTISARLLLTAPTSQCIPMKFRQSFNEARHCFKSLLTIDFASGGSGTTAFLSLLCRNTVRAVFRNNIVNVDSAGGSRHNAILTGKNLVRHGNRTTRGAEHRRTGGYGPRPAVKSYGPAKEILT